ncbi:MAG: hypothetical protein ACLR23_28305 [Clostridia bacterium]
MAKCCDVAADMASALGREGQAQYRDQARKLREAVNRYGWNEERSAYVDTVRDEKGLCDMTRAIAGSESGVLCPIRSIASWSGSAVRQIPSPISMTACRQNGARRWKP